jgi:hypothetical protein
MVRSVEPNGTQTPTANPPHTLDQLGSLCIALDVPAENVVMTIILDWETLESALVTTVPFVPVPFVPVPFVPGTK